MLAVGYFKMVSKPPKIKEKVDDQRDIVDNLAEKTTELAKGVQDAKKKVDKEVINDDPMSKLDNILSGDDLKSSKRD